MKIICLGDSLTAGYGVPKGDGWVELCDKASSHTWINAGISGDPTLGMLVRLNTQILPEKPDVVVWLGGFNDIMITASADQAKGCVKAFYNHCIAAGVQPVIAIPHQATGIPANWAPLCDQEGAFRALEAYRVWLRQVCRAVGLRCIDFSEAGQYLLSDGMHPDVLGHRLMAEIALGAPVFRERQA